MRETIQGNAWLCAECALLEPTKDLDGIGLTANWGGEDGENDGIREFDNTPCGYCGDTLAGYRYRFAYWMEG